MGWGLCLRLVILLYGLSIKQMLKIKENIAENDEDEVYEGITHLKLQQLL